MRRMPGSSTTIAERSEPALRERFPLGFRALAVMILFGGSLLVEVIYSYPGMGNLMVDAVRNVDLPVIQVVGLTYCVVVLLINSFVDGLYFVLNPRLRRR
jgi:ABC-type dipeptide/oligopeptide/nickel transport system permease component